MKTKHTKGSWSQRRTFKEPLLVRDEANDREWYASTIDIHAENDRIIGHVEYQTDCENQGWGKTNKISEWEANAKLIAAAPEMLEALEYAIEALRAVTSFGATKPVIERIEAVIKKATE